MARTRCSFCGKHEDEVRHLVAGPNQVAICDECVDLCVEVQASGIEFQGDLLLTGIGELTTNDRFVAGLLGTIQDASVAIRGGIVRWAGPELALPDKYRSLPTLTCGGRAAVPGFVDGHSHALFGGEQGDRFASSEPHDLQYHRQGVAVAVASTAATSDKRLTEEVSDRLTRMLHHGTTTVEVKTGFGGDVAGERRLLDLAQRLDADLAIDVVSTVLVGAALPSVTNPATYVDWVVETLLVECGPHASYIDIIPDRFETAEIDRLFEASAGLGLSVRCHVTANPAGAALEIALRHDAVSVDHLDHVTERDIERLTGVKSVAVLLPTSERGLGPPASAIWDSGVTVALGTDCNPVDSYVESMQLVISLAVSHLGLSVDQAVWAATRGGSVALEEPEKGWIGRGTFGDLVVLDAPSASHLAYRPGVNLAWRVIKDGAVVASP